MRIKCGSGFIAVHDGELDGIPCLAVGNNGTGIINGNVVGGEMNKDTELLVVTFTNSKSVDVWIKHLQAVKARIGCDSN